MPTGVPFYAPYIRKTDAVVDFGCGGGFLLDALDCGDKMGVEINPTHAHLDARLTQVRVVARNPGGASRRVPPAMTRSITAN
jgi:hypothetical protein